MQYFTIFCNILLYFATLSPKAYSYTLFTGWALFVVITDYRCLHNMLDVDILNDYCCVYRTDEKEIVGKMPSNIFSSKARKVVLSQITLSIIYINKWNWT